MFVANRASGRLPQFPRRLLGRDLLIGTVFALVRLYQLILLAVHLVATTEELFFRKSFHDNFVPAKVRAATWRW